MGTGLNTFQVANVASILNPSMNAAQKTVAMALVSGVVSETQMLAQLATDRFGGKGSITLCWTGNAQFEAAVTSFAGSHDYLMRIDAGAPLALVSIAHAIWATPGWVPVDDSLSESQVLRGAMADGPISPHAQQAARDATLLLYFHELAHVLWRHCELDWASTPSEDRRALEYDADRFAGLTFAFFIASRAPGWTDIAERLVRASLLLATALKAFSIPSDDYHFPTARMMAFMAGGFQTVEQLSTKQQGYPEFSGQGAENAFLGPLITEFLVRLKQTPLKRLAGTESEIEADFARLHQVTVPRHAQLRAANATGSLWDVI